MLEPYDIREGHKFLTDLWTMARANNRLWCSVFTHRRGWRLKLTAGTTYIRSHIFRTEQELLDTAETWWRDARANGWTATAGTISFTLLPAPSGMRPRG